MRNPLWKMGLFLRKRINSPKKDLLAVQLPALKARLIGKVRNG